jgi:hypothetical protein
MAEDGFADRLRPEPRLPGGTGRQHPEPTASWLLRLQGLGNAPLHQIRNPVGSAADVEGVPRGSHQIEDHQFVPRRAFLDAVDDLAEGDEQPEIVRVGVRGEDLDLSALVDQGISGEIDHQALVGGQPLEVRQPGSDDLDGWVPCLRRVGIEAGEDCRLKHRLPFGFHAGQRSKLRFLVFSDPERGKHGPRPAQKEELEADPDQE